jgi:hypothetical protein
MAVKLPQGWFDISMPLKQPSLDRLNEIRIMQKASPDSGEAFC